MKPLIAISAGHSAAQPGACYYTRPGVLAVSEFEEASLWRRRLTMIVREEGLDVREIQPGTLTDKIRQVNRDPLPMLALEIHFNSAVNHHGQHVGEGCETLYAPGSERGKHCAQLVQDALATIFPPSRGIKEGWYRMDVPGQVDYVGDVEGDEHADAFLVKTKCPALILEPDFIHRYTLINTRRHDGCSAIAAALVRCAEYLT